jgi:hypothetical protein
MSSIRWADELSPTRWPGGAQQFSAGPPIACPRLAYALSFAALRHLSIPASILPWLDCSKLGKLAGAGPLGSVTLTVLDPTGSALETFCTHAGPLLAVLNPARVVFNLDPIPLDVAEPPLGLLDVLEGEVLRDFKTALVAESAVEMSTGSHRLEQQNNLPIVTAEEHSEDDSAFWASSVLLQLACAADARRLAAEERLIRQIKTCLRVLTHAPAFATDVRLIRAFFADVEPCEGAFERRFVDVPFDRTGWLRVARPQTLDRTAGACSRFPFGYTGRY